MGKGRQHFFQERSVPNKWKLMVASPGTLVDTKKKVDTKKNKKHVTEVIAKLMIAKLNSINMSNDYFSR